MSSLEAFDDVCRRWEEGEHRFLALAAEADREAEFMPDEKRLRVAALLETARRELRESKGRVAKIAAAVADA